MILYPQWQLSYVYLVVLSLSFHNNDWNSCSITGVTSVPSLLSHLFHRCCHKRTIATGTIVTIEVVRLWQQLWYDCDNRHLSCSSNRLTSFFIICISRWLFLSLFTLKVDYYIWTRIWMIIAEITLKIAFYGLFLICRNK